MNSSIVALIALVISALEVYGKHIFRTALRFGLAKPMLKDILVHLLLVMLSHFNRSVDERQDVVRNELSFSKHTNTRAISIKKFTMLHELLQFHFCHSHQPFDLATWSVEVLDAEGIDSHDFDATLIANLENL